MLVAGCGKKHPGKVYVDAKMEKGMIEKIAVFPFASAVHHTDDPDGDAPRMMDMLFRGELDLRDDYKFVAPASVSYALEREGLGENAQGKTLAAMYQAVAAAIAGEGPVPASGEQGRMAMEMVLGIYASHKEGGLRVELPLADRRHPLDAWRA